MTKHQTGTRGEWLDARLKLLADEKEHTRRSDALAERRQQLPWVRIDKEYRFDTPQGSVTLKDLFKGRSQLMIYHFMYGEDYAAGCPSCSSVADSFNGVVVHLENHDVAFTAVSRASIGKLQAFKERMGWTFDWASSAPGDFNSDFNVYFTEDQQRAGIDYNYRTEPGLRSWENSGGPVDHLSAMSGTDSLAYMRDRPGVSAFALQDGHVYHTYSGYSRGVDGIWGMYAWLDRAPKGRNEDGVWWRHHDQYGQK